LGRIVASLISLLFAAAGLSACGGAGPTSAGSRAASARTQPSRTQPSRHAPPAGGKRGERALAHAALVRLADLSRPWREQQAFRSGLRCRSQPYRGARLRVSSGRFVQDNASFQETVAIFRDAAGSRRALARLDSRGSLACLVRTARQQMSDQAEGPATVPQLVRSEPIGRAGKALRFTATAPSQVGEVRGVIDAVHVRAGRGVGALLVVSGPQIVRDDVYDQVMTLFARRLHAALG
jgi:hypothetical protein